MHNRLVLHILVNQAPHFRTRPLEIHRRILVELSDAEKHVAKALGKYPMRLLHLRLIEEKVDPVEIILHQGIELRPLLHVLDKSNHILHNLSVGLTIGQRLREIPLGIANSAVGEELENLAVASLQFGDLVVHRLEILSELLQILLCILQLVRIDSQRPRQILGDSEIIDNQAMPLLGHHAVHAGNRLHESVLLQTAV